MAEERAKLGEIGRKKKGKFDVFWLNYNKLLNNISIILIYYHAYSWNHIDNKYFSQKRFLL